MDQPLSHLSRDPKDGENTTLSKKVGIRPFRTHDIHSVESINKSCLPENYSKAFYLTLHRRFPKTFIVATASERVVGYIMCRIELGFSELRRFRLIKKGHIVSIAVLPEHRGKGLGGALISKALEGMEDYGVKESYLEVRISNRSAIDLYRKLGFKKAKRVGGYYRDGEDAYVMAMKFV